MTSNKAKIMVHVREQLKLADRTSKLVNFFDDEVDWNLIAEVAVNSVLELQAKDKEEGNG